MNPVTNTRQIDNCALCFKPKMPCKITLKCKHAFHEACFSNLSVRMKYDGKCFKCQRHIDRLNMKSFMNRQMHRALQRNDFKEAFEVATDLNKMSRYSCAKTVVKNELCEQIEDFLDDPNPMHLSVAAKLIVIGKRLFPLDPDLEKLGELVRGKRQKISDRVGLTI